MLHFPRELMRWAGITLWRSRTTVFLGAVFIICARVLIPAPAPAESSAAVTDAALLPRLEAALAASGSPGAVLAIDVTGAETLVQACGWADIKSQIPMPVEAVFPVGSISKMFVAVVTLQLVEEGLWRLDDTLAEYGVEFEGSDQITIKHLLQHSSGLFDYTEYEVPDWLLPVVLSREYTPEEIIEFCAGRERYFAPGKGYHYSNTNFVLLGLLIEQQTMSSLARQIRQRIIRPLNLSHTYFAGEEELPKSSLRGYLMAAEKRRDRTDMENASLGWAAGSMVSSAADLLAFYRGLLGGELLDDVSLKSMLEASEHGGKTKYGLGIMTYTTRHGEIIGHGGMTLAFRSGLWYLPEADAVVVALTNQGNCQIWELVGLGLSYAKEQVQAVAQPP